MIMKLGYRISEAFRAKIRTCKESLSLRTVGYEKAFTRDRLLTAERIVSMIITLAKQSLQTRLKEFGEKFMDGVIVTKQAFSKQRQFVNPD